MCDKKYFKSIFSLTRNILKVFSCLDMMAVDLPRGHSGGGGYWNKKMGEGGALNRHRLDFRKER